MLSTNARPITRYEYVLIPDGAPRQELIEGDLVMAPSSSSFHQDILANLLVMFRTYLREHPIGKVWVAPLDTYLSDVNVFQPDLLFIRKENLAIVEQHGIEGAPDLAIEILSKSSARFDLGPKRSVYARTGVEELWIIDPAKRSLALYRFADSPDTPVATYKEDQKFTSSLLPGLSIELTEVFAT